MRANYLQKNRGRGKYLKPVSIIAAILVFGTLIFSVFDGLLVSAVSPVWKAENRVAQSFRNGIAFFTSQRSLLEENATLKERLSSLELQVLALSSGRIQEGMLLELAGRRGETGAITATVLTRPPQTPYDILVIDAGSNDAISPGSEVFLPEGPGLGVVSEVFQNRARVKLLSSSGEETEAVLERGNIPVTLVGAGGGNFRLIIPRDVEIERGDNILSAGVNSRLLAVVGEVSLESTDSFKDVLAKSPINIFSLRYVLVMP